eukprot:CAMPEP_0117525052 /NCGR_PEP_ID=MMETSP0784-20121206/35566_1 /TAXON_ID=39447 /ORGANISM="" /LENGTH=202 /DNA_ID=CAMNT_0005321227 /DNA_START=222 /DNA_END=829 /DNA_ORIENTATION=-
MVLGGRSPLANQVRECHVVRVKVFDHRPARRLVHATDGLHRVHRELRRAAPKIKAIDSAREGDATIILLGYVDQCTVIPGLPNEEDSAPPVPYVVGANARKAPVQLPAMLYEERLSSTLERANLTVSRADRQPSAHPEKHAVTSHRLIFRELDLRTSYSSSSSQAPSTCFQVTKRDRIDRRALGVSDPHMANGPCEPRVAAE